MVIANETIALPENPPHRWGVEVRSRTLKDYRNVAIASLIFLALLFFAVSPGWLGVDLSVDNRVPFWVFGGMAGIAVLVTLSDPGAVVAEADYEAARRSSKWQQEVLIPFLEKKYGIEIPENSLAPSWGWSRAYKDKRTLEFNSHGIRFERDSFNKSFDGTGRYFHNITLKDDVWLEEVIRPDRVTFRAMEEA